MIRFLNVEEIDVETYFSNLLVELYIWPHALLNLFMAHIEWV
jgi:hypothetical protein